MSHFYGTIQGNRGEATRCGSRSSGITTNAAGWYGAIRTHVYHNEETGLDEFEVALVPWQGSGGWSRSLAKGQLSANATTKCPVEYAMGNISLALKALDGYNDKSTS